MPLVSSWYFFFYCSGAHPALHSFPTRRSSDLCSNRNAMYSLFCRSCIGCGVNRSEEHTSELQSPYDLVCRLLLEKKTAKHLLYILPTRKSSYTLLSCVLRALCCRCAPAYLVGA